MRTINVLLSAIHLMVLILTILLGSIFSLGYIYPDIMDAFVKMIIEKPESVLKIGLIFLSLSFLLFITFYLMHRKKYFNVEMSPNISQIDTKVIKSYIEKHLKKMYPKKLTVSKVEILSNNKLEIVATMKKIDPSSQEDVLINIEEKIGKLLLEHLNYRKEFILTLNLKK